MSIERLRKLGRLARYHVLTSTTKAGSGHPTTALSATDLMTALMFGGVFRFNVDNPDLPNNDRIIFSKGHASPLLYALWTVAGKVSARQMNTLRQFGSRLEGHPTMYFPYNEAATGSLGQGLSIGLGMALNGKYLDQLDYRVYVLLGDGEIAEGAVWEAAQVAAKYKLDNLVGILDVNRLGQCGETMLGWNIRKHASRFKAFGWKTIVIDGHDYKEIMAAYKEARKAKAKPTIIIAKTIKGKGVSFLENKEGWHGKPLDKRQLGKALKNLGKIDRRLRGKFAMPKKVQPQPVSSLSRRETKVQGLATRKAYGNALVKVGAKYKNVVALDGEVSNSTYSLRFKEAFPERFFEMYIAEQNMVGAAMGLSRRGKVPFVSSFGAFLTRAFDQMRMNQYSGANIKYVGTHGGVSVGADGVSQMGMEDLAMARVLFESVVLYPSDAVSTERLVEEAVKHKGTVYIRTTRPDTPVIYGDKEKFRIGGSKVLRQGSKDKITVVAAGVTLHEALKAYEMLQKDRINIRVIDLYSIKPIDKRALKKAATETLAIITVEDHYAEGGLGEAIMNALAESGAKVYSLAVRKMPRSGKPEELLDYEEISAKAIVKKVKKVLRNK